MTQVEKRLKEIAARLEAAQVKARPKQPNVSCPVDPAEREACEGCQ